MKHATLVATLGFALALAPLARAAHPPSQMLEEAIETNAGLIALAGGGSISVRGCTACAARSLPMGSATRFLIGSRSVTLEELSTYLRAPGHGNRGAMIFYNVSDGRVSRVAVRP